MRKYIIQIKKERKVKKDKEIERKSLERKVEKGIEKAIDEYSEVFKKLAEYDRA